MYICSDKIDEGFRLTLRNLLNKDVGTKKLGCGLVLIIWIISIIVEAIVTIKDALFNSLGDFGRHSY